MGKVVAKPNVSNTKNWEELQRYSSIVIQDIVNQVNGNLTFSDNMNVTIVEHDFTAVNVPFAVEHGLGRVPKGYIVIGITANTAVYQLGLNDMTDQVIYLLVNGTCQARFMFF